MRILVRALAFLFPSDNIAFGAVFALVLVCSSTLLSAEPQASPEDLAYFENRIRPLLVEHCHKCHGARKQESGLRLDDRGMMLSGGDRGAAVNLQDPSASLLLKAVRHEGDLKMPPEKKLPQGTIAELAEWIRRGAPWPAGAKTAATLRSGPITSEERAFWSFQQPREGSVPEVKRLEHVHTPIDRFVTAACEAAGVAPAQPTDKRTLVRRASFDLTGLPPELNDVQAFLDDESPDAFPRVIDRLLASPAYGERWGRHWLDVVRYADTAGETADYPVREAYRYRDYVIRAFNDDKPYDQFVREQIAGDILARTAPRDKYAELVTATGYLAISRRFGFDSENYQHLTIQDTIDSLGQTFLGLTLGCARCHDHKFDPVTTSDYYALYGIFESSRYAFPGSEQKQRVRAMAPLAPLEEAAAAWRKYDERFTDLAQQLEAAKQPAPSVKVRSLEDIDGDFELQAVSNGGSRGVLVPPWMYEGEPLVTTAAQSPYRNIYRGGGVGVSLTGGDSEHSVVQAIPDHFAKQKALFVNFDFRVPLAGQEARGSYHFGVGNITTDWMAAEIYISSEAAWLRSGDEITEIRKLKAGEWYQVQLALDLAAGSWQATVAAPGEAVTTERHPLVKGFRGEVNYLGFDSSGHLQLPRPMLEVDNIAVSSRPFPALGSPPAAVAPPGERKPEEILAELHRLLESGPCELAYAVTEGTSHNARLQMRGEPGKLGGEVPRRWLEILGGDQLARDIPGSGRLELADWMTRKENPLIARVMVNRLWQHHFAQGLVATENDFGARGSKPSHPELLDYLARRFMADGWQMKKMHRRIMLSAVYQLASQNSATSAGSANRLLTHYPRQRLDAESIRDALLLLGGGLDRSTAGPHPFPAPATWSFTQHNPFIAVYDSPKRSVYLMTQRLKRHPYLALFDGADTNASSPRRLETTVPTQSLFLMNDPFVHQQSSGLARRILAFTPDEQARIARLYELALSRLPTAEELAADQTFLAKYRELLMQGNVADADRELTAWSALARTILTRNEFLFID